MTKVSQVEEALAVSQIELTPEEISRLEKLGGGSVTEHVVTFVYKKIGGTDLKVAILDDTKSDAQILVKYIEKFQVERNDTIQADVYEASFDFLEEYNSQYDVIFLDIEMPGSDGLQVAHEIRKKDQAVGIIFVTNMAQYAISGYEVNAIDFIVKPVSYYLFSEKLEKAIRFSKRREQRQILLNSKAGVHRILLSDILYVEKEKDNLVFHTLGETIRVPGTIKTLKDKLGNMSFSECTHGCLVNFENVRYIGKDMVLVGKKELPLSRRMRKQFIEEYAEYIGGGF
ncbi:LytTR family two component transcriptional regulator [Faecalicatena orotica]|uniref:Stage 0 sporulation protein A homolog n=1 Tax=Faecalicatena orotica TaxID=1544 RepID=A0A2Y9BMY5_9FIRM|nr:LytTR family two component transcriptional regulator [Faecalicatena orotica]SSA58368.1 two component transcriptional regulator, LytTR family [Faecalicatena orotica]